MNTLMVNTIKQTTSQAKGKITFKAHSSLYDNDVAIIRSDYKMPNASDLALAWVFFTHVTLFSCNNILAFFQNIQKT